MLTHYLTLGLAPGASDEEVRRRYLDLVRRHPPGRDPERFQRIAAAYEALVDERTRVRSALFGTVGLVDPEGALRELVAAARLRSWVQPPTLRDLLRDEGLDA